jgi:hypothetical protein
MKDLNDHLRQLNAAWAQASPLARFVARMTWANDGWQLCEHDGCRPWRCDAGRQDRCNVDGCSRLVEWDGGDGVWRHADDGRLACGRGYDHEGERQL